MCQHEAMLKQETRALAKRHLVPALMQRWEHVQAVASEARRLCAALDIDSGVVVAAAWLHDLGYAPPLLDSGFHPLDGARYLRRVGWGEEVCGLVAHHTDAARQADHLGLGDQLRGEFGDVEGVQRDALWMADATTGPSGERMSLAQRVAEICARYGPDSFVTSCMIASRPELEAAISRMQSRLLAAGR